MKHTLHIKEFAKKLKEAVYQIGLNEDKNLSIVQDELGYALGKSGGSMIEYWRKGKAIPSKSEDKEMFKGVELINSKLKETLKNKGLEQLQVKKGDAFDAEIHDAITQIPAPNKKMKGKIIDIVEKGFKLGEKIIRHPKVVVGN